MNAPAATPVATEPKTTILDGAKLEFSQRKAPAKDTEIKSALQAYFKVEDEIRALQAKIEELKPARTEATKKIVALRGMGRVSTKTKGVGQITARSEAAWISFSASDGSSVDI